MKFITMKELLKKYLQDYTNENGITESELNELFLMIDKLSNEQINDIVNYGTDHNLDLLISYIRDLCIK